MLKGLITSLSKPLRYPLYGASRARKIHFRIQEDNIPIYTSIREKIYSNILKRPE